MKATMESAPEDSITNNEARRVKKKRSETVPMSVSEEHGAVRLRCRLDSTRLGVAALVVVEVHGGGGALGRRLGGSEEGGGEGEAGHDIKSGWRVGLIYKFPRGRWRWDGPMSVWARV